MRNHALAAMLVLVPVMGNHYLGGDPAPSIEDRLAKAEKQIIRLQAEYAFASKQIADLETKSVAGSPIVSQSPTPAVMADPPPPTMWYQGKPIQIYQQDQRCVNGRCR